MRHARPCVTGSYKQVQPDVVRRYIYLRKKLLAEHFFDDAKSFYEILSDCYAVFSGFAALHLLLPAADTDWTPSDLDVNVPGRTYGKLEARLVW